MENINRLEPGTPVEQIIAGRTNKCRKETNVQQTVNESSIIKQMDNGTKKKGSFFQSIAHIRMANGTLR